MAQCRDTNRDGGQSIAAVGGLSPQTTVGQHLSQPASEAEGREALHPPCSSLRRLPVVA